jgi:hypothetical protein
MGFFSGSMCISVEAQIVVSVTPESVRERINVPAAECPDDVVNRFITDATETVEVETGLTIDPTDCTAQEAVAIRNLAAIYCACRVTGGSASGLAFRVGDLSVSESSSSASGLTGGNLQFLLDEAKRIIGKLNAGDFRVVNA